MTNIQIYEKLIKTKSGHINQIALTVGCSRNTVRNCLKHGTNGPKSIHIIEAAQEQYHIALKKEKEIETKRLEMANMMIERGRALLSA